MLTPPRRSLRACQRAQAGRLTGVRRLCSPAEPVVARVQPRLDSGRNLQGQLFTSDRHHQTIIAMGGSSRPGGRRKRGRHWHSACARFFAVALLSLASLSEASTLCSCSRVRRQHRADRRLKFAAARLSSAARAPAEVERVPAAVAQRGGGTDAQARPRWLQRAANPPARGTSCLHARGESSSAGLPPARRHWRHAASDCAGQ
jgi:hypothetical protein